MPRGAELPNKKLIIELHYRKASGQTQASLRESSALFDKWETAGEGIMERL